MPLHIFDTLTRQLVEFTPITPGVASIYACGATVQSQPHIGHMRSGIVFDILRRWLMWQGYDVLFIRNVTDIDDKILAKAAEANRPWWEWAATHENAFNEAYQQLGVLPPSATPHATGNIPQIIRYIQRIIDQGAGYASDGDVYFSVAASDNYGQLSRQKNDELQQGETPTRGKKDHRDFTLWKSAKPGEPYWDSPWGPGRPGWHIECSAMATDLLGSRFDIHGGGIDLVFPHHENEIAQCHAAGDDFAQYWMHNGWVTMAGEKMSKSLGNIVSIPNLLKYVRGIELRYYMSTTHYRSHQDFSFQALQEATVSFHRIESFLQRVTDAHGEIPLGDLPEAFSDAMNKDLAVAEALAIIHEYVTAGNALLGKHGKKADPEGLKHHAVCVRSMLNVLGCDPYDPIWEHAGRHDRSPEALSTLVDYLLEQRQISRSNKDYAKADELREVLVKAGIEIFDGPQGSSWQVARQINIPNE